VEVNDNHEWPFQQTNLSSLQNFIHFPRMQRAFSALVTYIQNACRAARWCMHMYTYSYIAKSAPKSARGSLAVNDSEGYSRISSLDLYVSRMRKRSDRTVQCEQSYTGGKSNRLRRLHVTCLRTNNLRNSISFCLSRYRGRDARDTLKKKKHVKKTWKNTKENRVGDTSSSLNFSNK